jgi:predicted dehydrogenase/threonine dehydrogenase-like Zn-dependent dehydrogenase
MIGAGAVARRHAATLGGFPDVEIAAVTDVDPGRAVELAEVCGARVFPDLDRMLAATALDAVYVCVPPFAHGPPELAAIDAGLALFVEKPVALDLATADAIAARVRESGIVTAVGYHWRYLDTVERARELLRANPPRLAVGYWLDKVPPPAWWVVRGRSGGQIVEQTTHVLDLLRCLAGEVSEVYARGARHPRPELPGCDIADVTSATLEFENGVLGAVVSTCLLPRKHRAGVEVVAEGMVLSLSEEELVVEADGRSVTQRPSADAKTLIDRDFVNAVKGERNSIRVPYEEALATQRLACAMRECAEDGRRARPVRAPTARTVRSLGVERPGQAAFFALPDEPPRDGGFRVETMYTGLSAGTELTFFKGTNPYLRAGWDQELGTFSSDAPARSYPVRTMGYMEVGRVTSTEGDAVACGERLAMAYGHKAAHTADPAHDRFVALPADLDPLLGIYVAHMGPICANGLLHAGAELVGSDVRTLGDGVRGMNVLVMGAGVVGLLTALFAAHHGAASVTVADESPLRLGAARGLGLDVVDRREREVWRFLKARHLNGPGDRGADVAFQCRARPESLAESLRSLRPQGAVIDLAFYTEGAAPLCLGEEFHHNGLTLRCAQISRVPRGLGHRWPRDRLSAETIELLAAHGDAIRRELVTDVVPFEEGPRLLEELAARRREVIQAVFEVAA